MGAILEEPKLVYPESDGKPMGETGIHVRAMMQLHLALEEFFKPRQDVYIATDMFWYWKEGRTKTVAPDVMVILGVNSRPERRSFFTWKENGAVPAVVFEMASAGTWKTDLIRKRRLYQRRGVKEYFIFDPEHLYLRPCLLGFRLQGRRSEPLFAVDDILSSDLGFDMRPEGEMLRLIDRTTGIPIATPAETMERARQAEQQVRAAEQQARAAEQQARAAEEEARREAEQSAQLRIEIERLKAMLANSGSPNGNSP